jgi:hypothetical protein
VIASNRMPRYVVRFKGAGDPPPAAREHIRAQPEASVIDESERMLLIDAPEHVADTLGKALPDWSVTSERTIPLPKDPRPKIRRRS